MKPCLIRQPAGIGDILFTQKIAKKLLETGRCSKVIWPVIEQYNYLQQYIGTPDISYIDEREDFIYKELYASPMNTLYENDDILYIPLQHSDQTTTLPDPRAHGQIKYKFCNLDFKDWKDYLTLKRDKRREEHFADCLNFNYNKKFNLINKNYGSPPGNITRDDISPLNGYQNLYMEFYPNIHLFDWMSIMARAEEIHTIETSLCYILEKMNIKNVNVYSKYTVNNDSVDDFGYIKENYDSAWKYIR